MQSIPKPVFIPEVWFWEDGVLEIYHLRGEGNDLSLGLTQLIEFLSF